VEEFLQRNYSWKILYFGATAVFALVAHRTATARGLHPQWAALLTLVYMASMGTGAHVLGCLVYGHRLSGAGLDAFVCDMVSAAPPLTTGNLIRGHVYFLDTFKGFWGGPLVFVLAVGALLILTRQDVRTKLALADVAAVSLPFALVLSKVGCFLDGCCAGVEGKGLLFVHYRWVASGSRVCGLEVFPTQLLDAALYTIWGVALALMHRRGAGRGTLLLWFVLMFSTGRILSEFTRGVENTLAGMGVSLVQVVLFLAVPAVLLALRRPAVFTRPLEWISSSGGEFAAPCEWETRSLRLIARRQIAALLLVMLVFPLAPILMLASMPRLVFTGIQRIRHPGDLVRRARFLESFIYLAAGWVFVTGFMIVDFYPAIIGGMVLLGMAAWVHGSRGVAEPV
jgi:hypothetical protein